MFNGIDLNSLLLPLLIIFIWDIGPTSTLAYMLKRHYKLFYGLQTFKKT